jgi:hypothetical protein
MKSGLSLCTTPCGPPDRRETALALLFRSRSLDWTPLGTTPSHPEYPAAHGCVTGVISSLIRDYFRTRKVHVVVDSLAFSDGVHTHNFDDTRDLFEEVFRACIYAGFHYRHSLEDGGALGRRVSRQLFRRHFRSLAERDDDGDRDDDR